MELSEENETAAMAKLKDGDGAALEWLYQRWKQPLMNYFHRMTGSLNDAEDLVLAVMEQLWHSAANYEARGEFPAWLFTLARRQLQHHWRSAARRLPPSENPDPAAVAVSRDTPAEETQRAEAIATAMAQLPDNQREAILLHIHSRLPGEAMAAIMDIPLAHFHVLVHRAKLNLKHHLHNYFHD